MRLRELIVQEDGEGGATTSADIATVAYPLFVRGTTRKQRRRNARAAVGQRDVPKQPAKKVREQGVEEEWSKKYKSSINCSNPKGFSQKAHCAGKKKNEAHVLNHDNVIYRFDKENPMSDTEVAVLGGAGRYSLKGLRDKARREASALAQDLSTEHGGAFRRSAENIKQLTNTINTIVAAYNELARLRRKGGRGSRGITDEDANFIRECIRVVEQAAQNYRLMEGLTQEPDPTGYVRDKLSNPKYTVVVNTPGDLDWYKIGTYWHNKIVDPHEFGQDDSDTVMVAQSKEEYKEMLAKINKMGLTYKTIGGTNAQPEIHDKA